MGPETMNVGKLHIETMSGMNTCKPWEVHHLKLDQRKMAAQ